MRQKILGRRDGQRGFPFKAAIDEGYLSALIESALAEDMPRGDLTSRLVIEPGARAEAVLKAREAGVVAGLNVFAAVFKAVDPGIRVEITAGAEGRRTRPGRVLARLSGPARGILSAERVALNFVQRLSGVATLTRSFVDRVRGTGVRILDTRKTTPGLRPLEKYAVAVGGGFNHRPSLSDLVLIKDNHIAAAGGLRAAIDRAGRPGEGALVEVEIGPEVDPAALRDLDVDIVMFDNWKPRPLRAAIREARHLPSRPLIEVSGRIRLDNVRRFALTGPDFISVGCLTHSAPALDLGLDFLENRR